MRYTWLKMPDKLKLSKDDFKYFLNSLSLIDDMAILNIKKDKIFALNLSPDRGMYLLSELNTDNDFEMILNLPSLSKLSKTLDIITEDELEFVVNSNNIEYLGKNLKFKYHLLDNGIIPIPKISLQKIRSLEYDWEIEVSVSFFKYLMKNSSNFRKTNKLYLSTKDGKLVWSFQDKTMSNSDSFVVIGNEVDFEIEEFIFNLNSLRLLSFGNSDEFSFKCNKDGMGKIEFTNNNVDLSYIIPSLAE